MRQSKHINIQIVGTPDDRKMWKSIAAAGGTPLGKWIREAVDAQIAAQSVHCNGQSDHIREQSPLQIEAVQS